jgi:hypothetical protein
LGSEQVIKNFAHACSINPDLLGALFRVELEYGGSNLTFIGLKPSLMPQGLMIWSMRQAKVFAEVW